MSVHGRVAALEAAAVAGIRTSAPEHWRRVWADFTDADLLALNRLVHTTNEPLTLTDCAVGQRYGEKMLAGFRDALALLEAGRLTVQNGVLSSGAVPEWTDAERLMVDRLSDIITNWSAQSEAIPPADTAGLRTWLEMAVSNIEDVVATFNSAA